MIVAWLVVVLCVVGALVYALAANPKACEMGRLMFACSLLAICLQLAGRMIRLM